MSIRILGGAAKGRPLVVAEGDVTRPTSVILRRKIFDSKQDLSGKIFFDICAGSGAMGLEAWSRGAEEVYFVESGRKPFAALKNNLEKCLGESDDGICHALNMNFETWLRHFHSQFHDWDEHKQKNSILFFDPPYENEKLYNLFSEEFLVNKWFPGELWIQSDDKKGVSQKFFTDKGVNPSKIFSHGSNFILVTRLI